MRTITEYQAKLKELRERLGAIKAKLTQENRDPSKEERQAMNDVIDQIEEVEDIILSLKRSEETVERLTKPEQRQIPPEQGDALQIAAGQQQRDSFANIGEMFAAVIRADSPGGSVDPRLRLEQRATGLGESVPSDGGYLVQTDFSQELLKQAFETGVLASRCREIPISSNSNRLEINGVDETSRVAGSRWGGIRAYWADEASEKTASKPKFRKIKLKLNKLIGLCYATDELLDDAASLQAVISTGFAEEFGFQIDDSIINGTGAGQPLGIINAGCLVTQTAESGQGAGTIIYENILKMWSRMFAKSRPNSVWLINQDAEPQLALMDVGGTGFPVYLPPGGASVAPYGTLFGRPVLPIEQCQTVGTAGDIYLADFNNYILATKGGMQSDMSIHVRFIYDESVFRFVLRVDGQPVLRTPITPFKGSNTLSHFINLHSTRT